MSTADEFRAALLEGDQIQAELVALGAVTDGLPVADLYVDVITPALNAVGERWAAGDLSVADEHLATAIVEGVMSRVGRSATRMPKRSRDRLVLAGAEMEGHVVGLRMLADLAEGAGFDVRYLGASVPVDALLDLVSRLHPRIVCLSVSTATPVAPLMEAVDNLARRPGLELLIGGGGVPPLLRDDPRVRYAGDVRRALDILEEIAAA